MTPATQAVRKALRKPLLSEGECRAVVREVLLAVRKPTAEMNIAGLQRLPFGPSSPYVAGRCFTAMIDAILQQEGGER